MKDNKDKINELLLEAEILFDSDNLYKPIQIYKQVLELDKNNISALINISDCLIKMNLDNEAKAYAHRAYLLHSLNDDMATVNYSCILISCKEYSKAIEILEKEKLNGSENHLVFNNLGYSYFLTEQYANALENYNLSIIIEEINPLAYCNRGNLKYFIFNNEEGINDLEKANLYGDFEAGMILQNIVKDKSLLS